MAYDPYVSYSLASPSPDTGNNQWDIGDLGVGEAWEAIIIVHVADVVPAGADLTLEATLDSVEVSPIVEIETTAVDSESALWITQTDEPDPVGPGDVLVYEIEYGNSGPATATGVVLTATLDSNVAFLDSHPSSSVGAGGSRYWGLGSLAPGGFGSIELRVTVNSSVADGTVLVNTARIRSNQGAPDPSTEDTQVVAAPDLTLDVEHDPSLFSPGKAMVYTLTYGNGGKLDAQDVAITTTLPANTAFTDTLSSAWTSGDGELYTYDAGSLPAGVTGRTLTFAVVYANVAQIQEPEVVTVFAMSDSPGTQDVNPADNSVTVSIGVPDLVITNVAIGPSPLLPYEPVTFTITIKNQGTGTAWNPDNQGRFYVDVFLSRIASYPFERYGEIYGEVLAIAPGDSREVIILHPSGFTAAEIALLNGGVYAKVDNHQFYPYGNVPEFDEMNNVWPRLENPVYLPLVARGAGGSAQTVSRVPVDRSTLDRRIGKRRR